MICTRKSAGKDKHLDTKLFEVRDRSTFIVLMVTRLQPSCKQDRYLLARSGYGTTQDDQSRYFWACKIDGGRGLGACDPYEFGCSTTRQAFQHIKEQWDYLPSGSVICTEYLRGDRAEPKRSEASND